MTVAELTQKSIQTVQVVELIQDMVAGIPERETVDLVDMFNGVKALNKASKDFQDAARLELLTRAESEGGQDDKGHRYLAGESSGIQVQRRSAINLRNDAFLTLQEADLLDRFPQQFDADKAEDYLRSMGVDEAFFTSPVVDKKNLEALVSLGQIPDEVVAKLVEEKVTHAVVEVKREAAQLP